MKPVIGVTPDFNAGDRKDMGGHEPTYFLRARYIRAVEELVQRVDWVPISYGDGFLTVSMGCSSPAAGRTFRRVSMESGSATSFRW